MPLFTTKNNKSITTIPGWSEVLNQQLRRGETKGASLYKRSVWANRCVQLKADALSGIPFGFFQNEEEVERENLTRLLSEGNDEENWEDILRGLGADLDVFGSAYLEKVGENTIVGINRINAGTVKPIIQKSSGEIVGFQQKVGDITNEWAREQIVYFRTYNPDNDLEGLSVLEVAAYSILAEIKANEYLTDFFANYAIPAAMLTSEQPVSDQEIMKTRRWWDRMFRGTGNQHKVAIAGRGLKYQKLGSNMSELALTEVRAELRRDICAVLGVPPALAGAWEAANYASSSEQRQSFYTETIIPRANNMAGVLNAELIPQLDANVKFGWKFKELDVMQPDMVTERQSLAELVRVGVITPEAAALQLGYEPEDVGQGYTVMRAPQMQEEEPEEKTMLKADLEKWQKKAHNAISKGKPPQVRFESRNISPLVEDVIWNKLGQAESKSQVNEIFKGFM